MGHEIAKEDENLELRGLICPWVRVRDESMTTRGTENQFNSTFHGCSSFLIAFSSATQNS